MKRFGLGLLMAAVVAFAIVPSAYAASKLIRMGLSVTEQHYEYKAMEKFKKYVEEKTNGDIKVELYSHSLGNDTEVLEAIKINAAQMNVPAPSVLGAYVKEFRLLELLFIFPNEKTASLVADSPWAQKLQEKLERVGYVGLGLMNFGFRSITNNVRPIETLKDLEGLKMRAMENNATLAAFRALGMNPTPMAFSEVFSALQLGTIDGQETPYTNIYQQRFNEVQKYISDSRHAYSWGVVVIGKTFFDGLSAEQQKIVREGARIAQLSMREAAAKEDRESLEKIIAAGSIFTPISDEVRAEMEKVTRPVVAESGKEISEEMYNELIEAIDELK